jgi:hypothetical protein
VSTQIYRSVKLVLQNNTNENLTIQGVAVLVGQWADKMAPLQGGLVGEQSAAEWMSVSTELGSGSSAFVRFGSSHGYLTVRWSLPWMGRFTHTVEEVPGVRVDVTVDDSHPDAVVMLVAVQEAARG